MTISPELEIQSDIEAMIERFAKTKAAIKELCPMKYALESLPELIGTKDYRDLCMAMGLDMVLQPPTGAEFAELVSGRVLAHERKIARREMSPGFKALLDADHKAAADFEKVYSGRVSEDAAR